VIIGKNKGEVKMGLFSNLFNEDDKVEKETKDSDEKRMRDEDEKVLKSLKDADERVSRKVNSDSFDW
jgi:hypothetical protein